MTCLDHFQKKSEVKVYARIFEGRKAPTGWLFTGFQPETSHCAYLEHRIAPHAIVSHHSDRTHSYAPSDWTLSAFPLTELHPQGLPHKRKILAGKLLIQTNSLGHLWFCLFPSFCLHQLSMKSFNVNAPLSGGCTILLASMLLPVVSSNCIRFPPSHNQSSLFWSDNSI